jgi:phage/plasmid-associated DNA primase
MAQENLFIAGDDDETNAFDGATLSRIQSSSMPIVMAFDTFMSVPQHINKSGDPSTNIVDRQKHICYNQPNSRVSKFFKYLEACRLAGAHQMLYERQQPMSGVMLDFDIKQTSDVKIVNAVHFQKLCSLVLTFMTKHLQYPERTEVVVGFTEKPAITYNSEHDYYKSGFHMLIPGEKVSREFKRFMVYELTKEDRPLDDIFEDIPLAEGKHVDILDPNSAHVGVFFIGSSSKPGTPPYALTHVYKVRVDVRDGESVVTPIQSNNLMEGANLCYEFSLNWEHGADKGGIIRKVERMPLPGSVKLIDGYVTKIVDTDEFDNDRVHNDLSLLNIHDPESEFIRQLLDTLQPFRYQDYMSWFQVLCALAHTSPDYAPLAEYFSRKSDKFDEAEFRAKWEEALNHKGNSLKIGSIHYWAKTDNPDRYDEVNKRNILSILYEKIYEFENEGCLEHFDVATILHCMAKNKFVFDVERGELTGTWYEYILEGEPQREGEIYKWRKHKRKYPSSLSRYISQVLPELFRKALIKVREKYEAAEGGLAKYHSQVYKNLQRTIRNLKNQAFKRGVMSEAETLFESIGFAENLDKEPLEMGVGNGVLVLGPNIRLLTGYHGKFISRYTKVSYTRMNPHNPVVRKLLHVLRALVPDDEPDTFSLIMHFLASCLDGKIKDSIILLLEGAGSNGKTFLVELHNAALGEMYGVKMPIEFLTTKSKSSDTATPALMQLRDARFAYYSESDRNDPLNEPRLKEVLGQETLAGRKLFGEMINFKPHCHHLAASNHRFRVDGTDHGIWRRMLRVVMKVRFVDTTREKFTPGALNERPSDPSLSKEWINRPDVQSAYLGILAYYYESLERNFNGHLLSVPHPHIKAETEEFRNSQDRINKFFSMFLVKTSPDVHIPITDVIKKYSLWHQSQYPDDVTYKFGLMDKIQNASMVRRHFVETRRGHNLVGHRVLDLAESKDEDEEYCAVVGEQQVIHMPPESPEEFYDRIVQEFDSADYKSPVDNWKPTVVDEKYEDSDIDEEIKRAGRPPKRVSNVTYDPVDDDDLCGRQRMIEALLGGDLDEDSEAGGVASVSESDLE